MTFTALWIIAILLSVLALEDIYQDARALDELEEMVNMSPPSYWRAAGVAIICVGGVWGFGFMLATLAGSLT